MRQIKYIIVLNQASTGMWDAMIVKGGDDLVDEIIYRSVSYINRHRALQDAADFLDSVGRNEET